MALAQIKEFARQIRDGRAEPEQVADVLRAALHDPGLQILLQRPGKQLDLTGSAISLQISRPTVGARLDVGSFGYAERTRAAVEARLPIEVSRWLQLELQDALSEFRASRSRPIAPVATEWQRLERDLHDGAQQLVAIGIHLRSLQHQLGHASRRTGRSAERSTRCGGWSRGGQMPTKAG